MSGRVGPLNYGGKRGSMQCGPLIKEEFGAGARENMPDPGASTWWGQYGSLGS